MDELLQWKIAVQIAQQRLTKWEKKKNKNLMDEIGIGNLKEFIRLMQDRIAKNVEQ